MSSIIHSDKRDIFPIWRRYSDAQKTGELNPLAQKYSNDYISKINKELDFQVIDDWKRRKTVSLAADILNFGLLHKSTDTLIFKEAANYLLENKNSAGSSLFNLAKKTINPDFDDEIEEVVLESKAYHINALVRSEIVRFKKMVTREPKFAVGWIELARGYVLLAQTDKAKKCIQTALHLAPNNRFVLRSAARFYIHLKDFDRALSILVKSSIASTDPWVLSSVLALSRKVRKKTNHYLKAKRIVSSSAFNPFEVSELSSAMATIDLFEGSYKDAKKLFEKSLIHPNDNSLAQAYWYTVVDFKDEKEYYPYLKTAFEAETVHNYKEGKIEASYKQNLDWISEEPFSTRPILTASYNALTFLEDYDECINVIKLGLETNPNDVFLKNNLAFALIMENKLEEANKILDNIADEKLTLTLQATRGLYSFRSGDVSRGRLLYLSTIEEFKKRNNGYMEALAFINYAREEILAGTEVVPNIISDLEKKYGQRKELDVQHLYKKTISLYKSKN